MVYLIHAEAKLAHAQHYLGYTENESVEQRLERHRKGNGSRMLRAFNLLSISYTIVRVWEGDRGLERKLKKRKNTPKLCPICSPRKVK